MAIGVAVDSSGNSYVTGYTDGGLDGNSSSGKQDFFLTKYNSSGTKEWTKQEDSSGDDFAYGVAVDSSDNIYVTGYTDKKFHGNNNSGRFDIFLVKYNSSGTKQWVKQLEGSSKSFDNAQGLAVDSSDNIYVTGFTSGGLDGNTSSGKHDIFLVKYNSSGTKQWIQQFGSSENDLGIAVDVDSKGNIYLTGYTEGGLDGKTNSGERDIFLSSTIQAAQNSGHNSWGSLHLKRLMGWR